MTGKKEARVGCQIGDEVEPFGYWHCLVQLLGSKPVRPCTRFCLMGWPRRRLHIHSRHFGYYGCLFIFNMQPEICLERNRLRSRNVEEQAIPYHSGLL